MIIAIDGPAGTGKSTVAKILAKDLGYIYVDTGSMYRACAYYCVSKGIEINEENLKAEIDNIDIEIKYVDGNQRIILNNEDVTDYLRIKSVNDTTSEVATIGIVREKLVDMQREMSKSLNVIMDGRDIGTVVFPNAEVKLFLVTDIDERVKRRMLEYAEKNMKMSEEDLRSNMVKRDNIDSSRLISPLKKAEDAIEIDTTKYSAYEVVQIAKDIIKEKTGV
ncbi:MAG: (d)CMP kinase [Clostridia bacterium]